MVRGLVKTYVTGFDEDILRGGIPQGHVVLISGPSGTMKSSFCLSVLYQNALHGVPGLYFTLEQTAGSLLEHAASLGFRMPAVSGLLPILDLSSGRARFETAARHIQEMTGGSRMPDTPTLAILKGKIRELHGQLGFQLLAIDSWDALELILGFEDRRAETFAFFEWLRELAVTSLLIFEEPELEASPDALEEEFLSDGIIHLRMASVTETSFQRRIQCVKMRSVNHNSDFRTLLFENGRFEIARAMG